MGGHEVELVFVMGEVTKDVTVEEAWDNIFGYTILLDISVRGDQDRSNRKSYDTFTVVGPWVVTADEIDDPQSFDRVTIRSGDVVTTGTPEGVSEFSDGDAEIESMSVDVEARDVAFSDVDVQKDGQ